MKLTLFLLLGLIAGWVLRVLYSRTQLPIHLSIASDKVNIWLLRKRGHQIIDLDDGDTLHVCCGLPDQ